MLNGIHFSLLFASCIDKSRKYLPLPNTVTIIGSSDLNDLWNSFLSSNWLLFSAFFPLFFPPPVFNHNLSVAGSLTLSGCAPRKLKMATILWQMKRREVSKRGTNHSQVTGEMSQDSGPRGHNQTQCPLDESSVYGNHSLGIDFPTRSSHIDLFRKYFPFSFRSIGLHYLSACLVCHAVL